MKRMLTALVALAALAAATAATAAAPAVTINVDRRAVVFGGMPSLNGTAPANSKVSIAIRPKDEAERIATVTAGSTGTWKLDVHPWVQTTYQATVGTETSDATVVFVKPRIELLKKGPG